MSMEIYLISLSLYFAEEEPEIYVIMNHIPKNIGVILAGGKGLRLGEHLPKQFLKIAGKKVIEHTFDVFQAHPEIDEIAVVISEEYVKTIEDISVNNSYTKLKKILIGGIERYESSLAAINAYENYPDDTNLIFHDSVRPLVSYEIISDCIEALKQYNAVDVAIKTTDTIISVKENTISSVPFRDYLYNGQTPQAFKLGTIRKAYTIALTDSNFKTTDDCGVVHNYLPEEDIYIVKGSQQNMKLTYKEDLFLLDKLFQLKSSVCRQDKLLEEACNKLKSKVIVVFGGSYGIGRRICELCENKGSKIYSFSRSNGIDVSDKEAVRKALEEVFNKEKRIDIVINTAGLLIKQSLNNMDYESIETSIHVNYLGSVIVAKESYKYLKASQGALLLYTSSSYTRGRALYSIYSSSKAAVVNFTQALAEEWYSNGIKVNCINPERTDTPMRRHNFGNEPKDTLLSANAVAIASINSIFTAQTGDVIDIKL